MANTLSLRQAKDLVNHTIDNNFKLQEEGKMPVAISFEASAGIGKTSFIRQVAEERQMGFTKLNMAQLEEPGDLIGFPQTEYECQIAKKIKQQDGSVKLEVLPKTAWLNAKQLDTMDKALVRQTGKTRMGYAKPAWVPSYNENGNIVLLDDYVRGNQQLMQACMDLILEQKYVSWSLPKNTTIVLTNNPDNGENNVSSLDEAQKSRFLNYEVEFDLDAWSQWAEKAKVDGRCINFVLTYSKELFEADDEGNRICNPRSFVMFADMISGIKDWDVPANLDFITMIAKGCFKDDANRFSQMFNSFIRNKMHTLIQPSEVLNDKWDVLQPKLMSTVYDSTGEWRPDIAQVIEKRFTNYVNAWLDSPADTPIKKVIDRIVNFIKEPETNGGKQIFNYELLYHMVKSITADHKNQTFKIMYDPTIAATINA